MPWSVGDVSSHTKKAKTEAQKKKWVSVANSVLKQCLADGGTTKDCEGKAIRIANSKFNMEIVMSKENQKIPQAALHFMDKDCFAQAVTGEGDKPSLDMVAYSGKVIKDHFWWGDLSIDIHGITFPKSKFPILENHDTSKKIAFSKGKPLTEGNQLKVNPKKVEFVDTEAASEFIKLSKAGFPYESSIYAIPTSIERLEKGTNADVNEMTVRGPATIWRQSVFKEASVCVFGWDSNTRSSAFSNTEVELDIEVKDLKMTQKTLNSKEVKKSMDLNQFKSEHPDAFKELMALVQTEVSTTLQTKFDKDKKDLEDKFAEERKTHENQMADRDKRVLELEKKDTIRSEKEMKMRIDSIWRNKLSESEVPDHLYDKVKKQVSYSQFVKDGILDEDKFVEAIEVEIKDWIDKGITSTVLGSGFGQREVDEEVKLKEADTKVVEDTTKTLLRLAGQKEATA